MVTVLEKERQSALELGSKKSKAQGMIEESRLQEGGWRRESWRGGVKRAERKKEERERRERRYYFCLGHHLWNI